MINLRLAEYNLETEKFERFLELGKDFAYCGEFLILKNKDKLIDGSVLECWSYIWRDDKKLIKKDPKDPLNRFNGLFDCRTYGEGRFVLIIETNYTTENNKKIYFDDIVDMPNWPECAGDENLKLIDEHFINTNRYIIHNIIGNLHENPELWEKVK